MSHFMDLCAKRQSCRGFSHQAVERDKLVACVEAAGLAPSACNSQPWSFVVVREPGKVAEVAKTTMQLGINQWASTAQAFFIVLEEHAVLMPKLRCMLDSQYFACGDVGGAVAHLCLAAEDQGIGTCIIGIFDREKLCSLLDIPVEKRIRFVIAAGYPLDQSVRAKKRKSLDDILRVVE